MRPAANSTRPTGSFVDTPQTRREFELLDTIAEWMDRRYLDPILGFLFPGAADMLCSLVGLYGVFVAARLRVHPVIIARMLLNLALDTIIGYIPVLGWIGDFFFRAHVRNLNLLQARGEAGKAQASDWFVVLGAGFLFLIALVVPFLLLIVLIRWLANAL